MSKGVDAPTLRATLLGELRKQPWAVGTVLGLLVAEVATGLLRPWPMKFVIDFLTHGDGPTQARVTLPASIQESVPDFLLFISCFLIGLTALEGVLSYRGTTSRKKLAGHIALSLRCRLFARIQRLNLSFHHAQRTGELMSRVGSDVSRIEGFVGDTLTTMLRVSLELVGMVAILLWLDWRLTSLAIVFGPLLFWVTVSFTRSIKKASHVQRKLEGRLTSITQETLSSIQLVKAFSREAFMDELFQRESGETLKASLAAAAVEAKFLPMVRMLMTCGVVLVLCFGVLRVRDGILSTGELWIFLSYFRGLRGPMKDLSRGLRRLAHTQVRWERVSEILGVESSADDPARRPAPQFRGRISLCGVEYAYDARKPVLQGVDLEVEAQARIAIVGPTGEGKSTLAGLISGLYEPSRGHVAIDGHDLGKLRPESVREQFALVLQESVLLRTSLGENIEYGRLGASPEEIIAAAKAARIHDFIESLPDGYDTVVGERGATLSGGQRQRIAIARAVLRDAPLLILDEPTTGLDPETEAEVWEALRELMQGRTTILISHRPHLAEQMDRVYRLSNGSLAEVSRAA